MQIYVKIIEVSPSKHVGGVEQFLTFPFWRW